MSAVDVEALAGEFSVIPSVVSVLRARFAEALTASFVAVRASAALLVDPIVAFAALPAAVGPAVLVVAVTANMTSVTPGANLDDGVDKDR